MDIKTHVELPDRHLLNLSPRPQQKTKYQAYRADYNYTSTIPVQRNSHQVPLEPSSGTSTESMVQKTKATKLPVVSSVPERAKQQRNQTPSPTSLPKPLSSATLSSTGTGTPSPGSDRDQYWKKLRDRFDKGSPLAQRASYHRTRAGDKKISLVQAEHVSQISQPYSPGASPRSAIPSPKSAIPSPSNSSTNRTATSNRNIASPQVDSHKRWRKKGGSWVSLESEDGAPQQSDLADTTTESSPQSRRPSISPISDVSSVTTDCDWEDRFVVHMPSAKDPNPPTMTTEEIANYQNTIGMDKARRSDQLRRSPRMPHTKSLPNATQEKPKTLDQYGAYDGSHAQPQQNPERQQLAASPQSQESSNDGHYYSPDEVGKNRISTIWEESPTRSSKEKRVSHNPDGSFLGCKEINGSGTKNPDDVLLFASGEDSTTLHPRPLAIGAKKRLKEKAARGPRKSEEKIASPDEARRTSQSSSRAPCSRQSSMTLCQEQDYPQRDTQSPDSQESSKENSQPQKNVENRNSQLLPDGRHEDDVFIITPTITRTLIPTPNESNPVKAEKEKKGFSLKPQGLRRPGGIGQSITGEAMRAVRAKAQVISTPSTLRPMTGAGPKKSTLPSLGSSKKLREQISLPISKDDDTMSKEPPEKETKDKIKDSPGKSGNSTSSSIRGFIRTTGLAKSTSIARSPTGGLANILRNGTESLRNRAESLRNGSGSFTSRKGSPVSLPTRDNSESGRSEKSFKSAKESARETPPPSEKTTPIKKTYVATKLAAEKISTTEKVPPDETTEERTPSTKSPKADKANKKIETPDSPAPVEKGENSPKPEKMTRSERLEKFKEQARLRRAAKSSSKAKNTDKPVVIAELDGEQVQAAKENLQPNITDVEELRDLHAAEKDDKAARDASNTIALTLVFEIVFLTVTNLHKLAVQMPDSPYLKFIVNNVLSMANHCFDVSSCIYRAITVYQATGTWPKPRSDQAISRFLVEVLQALVYMVILGFGALIVGRAASYALLVGSWILWFAKPIAWAFHGMTRFLIS